MLIETIQELAQRTADVICDLRRHPTDCKVPRPKIIAHRGAWDRQNIENTMQAFERARTLGAWAIELDIRFTKDNVAVVHHDPDLKRRHRYPGVLRDMSFKDLRANVPAVPTLAEVLALKNLHFMLEVKTALGPDQITILQRQFAKLEPIKDFHLLTLQPELVRSNSSMPQEAWILVGDINLNSFARISMERGLGGVVGHYLFMTNSLITQLHERGQKAGSGFLPSRNLFNREWARGVDWAFTNHLPALAKSVDV
jgi:glycerophosphoryl diester phosphodiesterase